MAATPGMRDDTLAWAASGVDAAGADPDASGAAVHAAGAKPDVLGDAMGVLGAAQDARDHDPEARLQHARDLAWAALNRRERTVAELARLLARKRVEPAVIDEIVGELCEQGYLDDADYARRFAEDRRRLDGWGQERIERRLRSLGVGTAETEAALAVRDEGDELEAALALLRRRFPDPPATPRDAQRALGVLVRKGYGLELAHDALRRHAGVDELD